MTSSGDRAPVLYNLADGVATVTLNEPDTRNALVEGSPRFFEKREPVWKGC
jgi:enoyl-CoA hydratase/carnithine racemase